MRLADLARTQHESGVTLPSAITGRYIEAGVSLIIRTHAFQLMLRHSLLLSLLSSSSLAACSFRMSEHAKVLALIILAAFLDVFV